MSLPEMLTQHPTFCPAVQAHDVARPNRLPGGDGRRDHWRWLRDSPERNQRVEHDADDCRHVSGWDMVLFYVAADYAAYQWLRRCHGLSIAHQHGPPELVF